VTKPPSVLLVADEATFAPFAAAVGADIDKTLRDYDIQDSASLRDLLQAKLALQLLSHDDAGARESIAAIRAAQSKADQQLLSGRLDLAYLDAVARAKTSGGSQVDAAFSQIDLATVDALPWSVVEEASGNANADASFAAVVPASLRYPNLITVGAVNQAGDATGFTSYGPTVAVYAHGFQIPSKIPGGHTVKLSGTSMAAPNVTNLAAKLFALDPSLTPVQVRALIVNGATTSDDGKRLQIDPKHSAELLSKKTASR
jgi:hypothetical protein